MPDYTPPMPPTSTDNRAEEIKLLARDHAELAIGTLADVAGDAGAKDSARVMAAKTLLERGFGAPERKVEQRIDHHVYDERVAHLEALQTLAKKRGPVIEDVEYTKLEDKSK